MNHFKFLLISGFILAFTLIVDAKKVIEKNYNGNDAARQYMVIFKPTSADTVVIGNTSNDIAQLIPGKWEIAANKRASEGYIIFNQNGTYEMYEKFHDGTGVTKKGEYILNSIVTPARIDICLDKCNQDGSEWTTLFGIIKAISDDQLEICFSANSTYPSAFSEDKSDERTMILNRTK